MKGGYYAQQAEAIALPVLKPMGLDLVDVDFIREDNTQILRFYIDKRGGVSLDDCERASRALDPLLDEQFKYKKAYILEVSSPGLTRALKTPADLARHEGEKVDISLYAAVDGSKQWTGILEASEEGQVRILTAEGSKTFDMKQVGKVSRTIEF